MLRTAFALPYRVLSSTSAARRAALVLLFAVGVVLLGWAMSDQARAAERSPAALTQTTDLIDRTAEGTTVARVSGDVSGALSQVESRPVAGALSKPANDRGPRGLLGTAAQDVARISHELPDTRTTVIRPLLGVSEDVADDLLRPLPAKPRKERPGVVAPASSGTADTAPRVRDEGTAPSKDIATVAPVRRTWESAPSLAASASFAPDREVRAIAHADRDRGGMQRAARDGDAPTPRSPRSSAIPDDAVVGSSPRGGDTCATPALGALAALARVVPAQGLGAPVADPIDRPEEVLVSPA